MDSGVIGYLTSMDALRRKCGTGDPTWKFTSIEALVLHYGRPFTPAPLPAEILRGAKKDCFGNAIRATAWGAGGAQGLVYVEGYATHIITTLHAWVTDQDGKLAFDPTWDEGHEYFGIAFKPSWAAEIMVKTGVYGLFGGENRDLLLGFVKDGIPEEALAFPATEEGLIDGR